jgi:CRP-like cAMP-binding protein
MPCPTLVSLVPDNRLLAALPAPVWQRLRPGFERVWLARRRALHEPGQTMTHAYFPAGAVVSLMDLSGDGATSESAVVGDEGMVGVSLLLGGGSSCSRGIVETAGEAWRVPAPVLQEEFKRAGPTMQILLRYMQTLLTQTAQGALCNRHHSIAQQFARFLLQSLDRQRGTDLWMTHEVIAERLGVRREGITECALRLRRQGLIRYSRGLISVLDRGGIEPQACECYGVLKREGRRLLPEALTLADRAGALHAPLAA